MTRRKHSRPARDIAPVHPHAAAVDIGTTLHVAAVRPGCDPELVRTFGTFTTDLHRLADWFEQCGVETVAMESTGVYWIPLYEILDQRGFEVVVVNARDAKHVPGRKTDVSDAAWLQRLHEYGLLRASFRPTSADRDPAELPAPARASARSGGRPHPAHAEGADRDEPAAPSRRRGRDGRDGPAHPPGSGGRRARSGHLGGLQRPALQGPGRDPPRGPGRQLPGGARLRPGAGSGTVRYLSSQGGRVRPADRSGVGAPQGCQPASGGGAAASPPQAAAGQ